MSIAMPSSGWIGPCIALRGDDLAAGLPGEQVDRVRRVMPQQVVGPRARLAERVHVRAAEEVGLHVHLLDVELARPDLPVHPLVAGIEAARVADHRDLARCLLRRADRLGVLAGCRRAGSRPARACPPRGRRSPAPRASASACTGSPRRRRAARGSRRGRSATCPMPYFAATSSRLARARGRPARRPRRRRSVAIASRCLMPNAPAPARHDLHGSVLRASAGSPGSGGRRRCSTRARGRSGGRRAAARRPSRRA